MAKNDQISAPDTNFWTYCIYNSAVYNPTYFAYSLNVQQKRSSYTYNHKICSRAAYQHREKRSTKNCIVSMPLKHRCLTETLNWTWNHLFVLKRKFYSEDLAVSIVGMCAGKVKILVGVGVEHGRERLWRLKIRGGTGGICHRVTVLNLKEGFSGTKSDWIKLSFRKSFYFDRYSCIAQSFYTNSSSTRFLEQICAQEIYHSVFVSFLYCHHQSIVWSKLSLAL